MSSVAWLQSYSGVRATVGLGPQVDADAERFAFRHAYCYALSRLQADPNPRTRFVVARDPRPTSPALGRAQAEGLSAACRHLGVSLELIDLGIASTPLWQHSVRLFDCQGGVMITASHNPIEDNGWKYATGVTTVAMDPAPPGALLSAAEMANLIRAAGAFTPLAVREPMTPAVDEVSREHALVEYVRFIARTYSTRRRDSRVVLDPNGGAACGIAERVFHELGIEAVVVNGQAGQPAHEVDVEHVRSDGTHVLDALADRVGREGALFGLAFDFDADRGNLTYVDAGGRAHIPSPQAAAAINTAIALAVHRRAADARPPAVVASDATSCRVNQIAAAFGAEMVTVETGEINVVSAMRDLEVRGKRAVVGVEGASGGTIFAGTTCRDGALVGAGALLAAADDELRTIIAETLAPGRLLAAGLAGLIDVLPPQRSFTLKRSASLDWSKTVDRLNRELPVLFASELSSHWARFDIEYTYTKYAGRERPLSSGYGWKARFFRPGGEGFLWIRGSKTEAGVVRIVGDGPDIASAQAFLQLGERLLGSVPSEAAH
jgi:phosphomannomutase